MNLGSKSENREWPKKLLVDGTSVELRYIEQDSGFAVYENQFGDQFELYGEGGERWTAIKHTREGI